MNMVKIEYKRNCVCQVAYHVVWCTKYRKQILADSIAKRADQLIEDICGKNNWPVISKEIQPDHRKLFLFNFFKNYRILMTTYHRNKKSCYTLPSITKKVYNLIMAKKIKNIIHTVFSKKNNWKIQLLQHWPKIIGELQTKVRLEKIHKDSLVLGVYDSCWLQELYLLSPILLKRINQKLENQTFKRLRFKQVGIKKRKKIKQNKRGEIPVNKKVTLTSKQEETLKKIRDPDLCDALKNFLIRCYQEKDL